jgi:hypothetical protein
MARQPNDAIPHFERRKPEILGNRAVALKEIARYRGVALR